MRGRVVDVIICVKFYRNRLRGFRVVGGRTWGLPLTLTVALTTGQHYRAACDKMNRILTTGRFKRQICIELTDIVAVHIDVVESI